jgi:flavodoxin I|tara:strand:+ start:217 stop:735 length:519 start_codon:yes stop_codon:yes gene_type:complete
MKIGLIYGSDTGATEDISIKIEEKFNKYNIKRHNIANVNEEIILSFDFLIFGLSTWYDGDLQSDWEIYFEDFKKIDFKNKLVAIYGLGDQWGYDEYFVDGIGIIAKEITKNNGKLIGEWPTKDYEFTKSKALKDKNTFFGLALDEDNQYEETDSRIKIWTKKIIEFLEKSSK